MVTMTDTSFKLHIGMLQPRSDVQTLNGFVVEIQDSSFSRSNVSGRNAAW